jgi:MacB-like periplasmic core domain
VARPRRYGFLAAQYIVLPANLTGVGDATQISVGRVSGTLFDVLGVRAALGRTLMPGDEPSAQPEVAVITDAAWRQRFGSDPRVIGRALVLEGMPRTIVGVLPPDFRLPTERLASNGDVFVPIHRRRRRCEDHVSRADPAAHRLFAVLVARPIHDVSTRQDGRRSGVADAVAAACGT